MKESVIVLFLFGTFFVSPLALAQNQAQTYSTFDRFIDNTKMIFTFGEKKVMLSLNIREKELSSAVINTKNGKSEEAEKNLEGASKKLQYVQTKVSKDIADDVKANIDRVISKINEEENLPDHFQTYILQEEKTQLTADLVSKIDKDAGQSLTRDVVKDSIIGESRVEVAVAGNDIRTEVMEIEDQIKQIDIQIVGRIIKEVEKQIDTPSKTKNNNVVTPKPNVFNNEVDPGPEGIVGPGPGIVDND